MSGCVNAQCGVFANNHTYVRVFFIAVSRGERVASPVVKHLSRSSKFGSLPVQIVCSEMNKGAYVTSDPLQGSTAGRARHCRKGYQPRSKVVGEGGFGVESLTPESCCW